MAVIRSINMESNEIMLTAEISKQESMMLKGTKDIIMIPEEFNEELTAGKLGNSNRIMISKKILKEYAVELKGKVPAKTFAIGGRKYILIKIDEEMDGVPKFKE